MKMNRTHNQIQLERTTSWSKSDLLDLSLTSDDEVALTRQSAHIEVIGLALISGMRQQDRATSPSDCRARSSVGLREAFAK